MYAFLYAFLVAVEAPCKYLHKSASASASARESGVGQSPPDEQGVKDRQRRDVRLERGRRILLRLLVAHGLGRHQLPDGVPLLPGKCR